VTEFEKWKRKSKSLAEMKTELLQDLPKHEIRHSTVYFLGGDVQKIEQEESLEGKQLSPGRLMAEDTRQINMIQFATPVGLPESRQRRVAQWQEKGGILH